MLIGLHYILVNDGTSPKIFWMRCVQQFNVYWNQSKKPGWNHISYFQFPFAAHRGCLHLLDAVVVFDNHVLVILSPTAIGLDLGAACWLLQQHIQAWESKEIISLTTCCIQIMSSPSVDVCCLLFSCRGLQCGVLFIILALNVLRRVCTHRRSVSYWATGRVSATAHSRATGGEWWLCRGRRGGGVVLAQGGEYWTQ